MEVTPSSPLKSRGTPSWHEILLRNYCHFPARNCTPPIDGRRGNLKGVRDSIYTPCGRHFRPLTELLARPLAPRFRNPVFLDEIYIYVHIYVFPSSDDFPKEGRRGCGDTKINRVAKWTAEGREGGRSSRVDECRNTEGRLANECGRRCVKRAAKLMDTFSLPFGGSPRDYIFFFFFLRTI